MIHTVDPAPGVARGKKADLASTIGAGVLGAGLGLLAAPLVGAYGVPLVLVGVVLHAWGMAERRRLESGTARLWWAELLYWGCWAALVVVGGFVALGIAVKGA